MSDDPQHDPTYEALFQFFGYAHLPPALQVHSKPFHDLAEEIIRTLPRNPERTAALRKLVEAKDCAVRARIYKDPFPAATFKPA